MKFRQHPTSPGGILAYTLTIISLSVVPVVSGAQIIHTADFTNCIAKAGIEYLEDVEQFLHVVLPPVHAYMDYDLVLQNDINDFEVRYAIRHDGSSWDAIPASVEIARLVASIASNDENTEIRIQIPADEQLRRAYHADRGIVARFTPKADFSEKQYGALMSLYAQGHPEVRIVLLYTDPSYDPLRDFRNIRFRDKE